MEAYLDNSATTPVSEGVARVVMNAMTQDFGNPSSKHLKGVEAERLVREARERIAATMHVSPGEIFFTSGGTESNNWALVGAALANRRSGNHIITTAVEHAAVLQPLAFLEELGFRITHLKVDAHGRISPEDLKEASVWCLNCIRQRATHLPEQLQSLSLGILNIMEGVEY